MKTIIEMAREAGTEANQETHPNFLAFAERFAALVREDERDTYNCIANRALEAARRALKYLDAGRFTDASDYAADFWEEMENLTEWEAGISCGEKK